MCKYCKTSGTCLEIAEYNSIYCRLHRRIPIVIEKTYEELEKENQHLKKQLKRKEDIINKAKEYISKHTQHDENGYVVECLYVEEAKELLEILDNKGE